MKPDILSTRAESYLKALCSVIPNRRTGSSGNRQATDYFAKAVRPLGYDIDVAPFECLDHIRGKASLTHGEEAFEVFISPYSIGCKVGAKLAAVSTVDELEGAECEGRILLMKGAICLEQLMPKHFVFYNPEHHQKIVSLLEQKKPAAIVTATKKNPDQVGALYPYPLIVDGDFDIPSVYCLDSTGDALTAMQGDPFRLTIDARRVPSHASNVIARLNRKAPGKIVVTAHIDAYEDTPGASDNASGTVVLLLLAELLSGYCGSHCIEIAALNGEDHYSAAGQMNYLERYGKEFPGILLAMNVDDVGYKRGKSAYSFYECPQLVEKMADSILRRFDGLARGAQWFNGDHMIFVQNQIPSVAFTSEKASELMATVTHTSCDTPDIIESRKLVEMAQALNALVRFF